jgi:2-phospho-L-lactate guanylyltransferase
VTEQALGARNSAQERIAVAYARRRRIEEHAGCCTRSSFVPAARSLWSLPGDDAFPAATEAELTGGDAVAVIVPFRGIEPKRRLAPLGKRGRWHLALAMLEDVVGSCVVVGPTFVVTDHPLAFELAESLGARGVHDPGGGQGVAVATGIKLAPGRNLVVNADLPALTPSALQAFLRATPAGGVGLVAAADGTTNALSWPSGVPFEPLYGRESAARFSAHARKRGLEVVSVALHDIAEDVDTLEDLDRVRLIAGPRTQLALAEIERTDLRPSLQEVSTW